MEDGAKGAGEALVNVAANIGSYAAGILPGEVLDDFARDAINTAAASFVDKYLSPSEGFEDSTYRQIMGGAATTAAMMTPAGLAAAIMNAMGEAGNRARESVATDAQEDIATMAGLIPGLMEQLL